jgi:hypothetical protein
MIKSKKVQQCTTILLGIKTKHLGQKLQAIGPIIPAYSRKRPPGTPHYSIPTLRKPNFGTKIPPTSPSVRNFEDKQSSKQAKQ